MHKPRLNDGLRAYSNPKRDTASPLPSGAGPVLLTLFGALRACRVGPNPAVLGDPSKRRKMTPNRPIPAGQTGTLQATIAAVQRLFICAVDQNGTLQACSQGIESRPHRNRHTAALLQLALRTGNGLIGALRLENDALRSGHKGAGFRHTAPQCPV